MMREFREGAHPLNVIIGLGGNGVKVLNSFANALPSKENFLILGFDTHPASPEVGWSLHEFVEYHRWLAPFRAYQLERLPVSVIPRHATSVSQGGGEGALRYRDFGRACFYWNREDTMKRIIEGVSEYKKEHSVSGINFVIVATLGGGTGSGAVIDLAQSIKRVFEPIERNFCIDTFLVLPSALIVLDDYGSKIVDITKESGNEFAFANTCAALLELREVIGGEQNPFHMINLISSWSIGEWDDVDRAIVKSLNDLYRGSLGETGNIFQGMLADQGFTTIIPAGVEFPAHFVKRYIDKRKELRKVAGEKSAREEQLKAYISREGMDPSKDGTLIRQLRTLIARVDFAYDKMEDVRDFRNGFHLFKEIKLQNKERALKRIFEEIFGTNRAKWDDKVNRYEREIKAKLNELLGDAEFVNKLRVTGTLLADGKAQGAATGETELVGEQVGSLLPFMDECERVLQLKREVEQLQQEVERLEQEERRLAGILERPTASNVIPVDEGWLNSLVEERVKLYEYMPPHGTRDLMDLLTQLKGGNRAEAEGFYKQQVDNSLRRLVEAVGTMFRNLGTMGLSDSAYMGKLAYKLIVSTRPSNYELASIKELIANSCREIREQLGLPSELTPDVNRLDMANTYLAIYLIIGHLDVNQLQEWGKCKAEYLARTSNGAAPGEAHAWGINKDELIWTKEHIEKVIEKIESIGR